MRHYPRIRYLATLGLALVSAALAPAAAPAEPAEPARWKAGVAVRQITPEGPIWLAGYANRTTPSDGVDLDLFAKALALDDGAGGRIVIVTLDLIGIPRALRDYAEREAGRAFGLKPAELLLNASHTHSGPQVSPDRMALERSFSRAATADQIAAVTRYEGFLRDTVVALVGESLHSAASARIDFGQARAGFAMNRRRPEPNGTISNNPFPAGPVDHDVPVLKVTRPDGKVAALVFGYACHNTTLSGSRISGDYSGYAQKFIEEGHPGAAALFLTGCAGDQNPYPRRGMVPNRPVEELVQDHGRALANAVFTALASPLRPVRPPLRGAYDHALLAYEPLADAALAKYQDTTHTPPVLERARALQRQLQAGGRPAPLPCPVQVLRFGQDLTLVAIGGEVVVDYSLRIKKELKGTAAIWVAGYSNDVFGYLASRRLVEEGGYEGLDANVRILNHPGPFATGVEETVMAKVHELHRQAR